MKSKFKELLDAVPIETKQLVKKQNEIAEHIHQSLKRKNITQKAFAQQLGMKESQLCRILAGETNLTLRTIVKIETALKEEIVQITTKPTLFDLEYKIASDYRQKRTFKKNTITIPSTYFQKQFMSSGLVIAESQEIYVNLFHQILFLKLFLGL